MRLAVRRQVGPFGEVLAEQAIGVLVGTALPRALRIAEVNIDVGRQAKPPMIGQFLAAVPGQRFVQFARQLLGLLDERRDHRPGAFIGHLGQQHIARMTFHQGDDVTVLRSRQEIALPVTRQPGPQPTPGAL